MYTEITEELRNTILELFAKNELDIKCTTGGTYAGVVMKNKLTADTLITYEEGERLQLFGHSSFVSVSKVKNEIRRTLFVAELCKQVNEAFNVIERSWWHFDD